jgi:hypothetical protein
MLKIPIAAAFIILTALTQSIFGQDDGFISTEAARADARQVDIVAHVNVRELKVVGTLDGNVSDCGQNKRAGYCSYLLTADVIEVFKGKYSLRRIEFYTTIDADYPSERLIGEKIVFLNRHKNSKTKKIELGVLENSTRPATPELLDGLRARPRRSNSKD